jgi:hypothetical protein
MIRWLRSRYFTRLLLAPWCASGRVCGQCHTHREHREHDNDGQGTQRSVRSCQNITNPVRSCSSRLTQGSALTSSLSRTTSRQYTGTEHAPHTGTATGPVMVLPARQSMSLTPWSVFATTVPSLLPPQAISADTAAAAVTSPHIALVHRDARAADRHPQIRQPPYLVTRHLLYQGSPGPSGS